MASLAGGSNRSPARAASRRRADGGGVPTYEEATGGKRGEAATAAARCGGEEARGRWRRGAARAEAV